MKLSEYLKKMRQAANLTQHEAAMKLGYTNGQFISNWERGLSSPPAFILKDLAKAYKISADDLFQRLLKEQRAVLEREFRTAKRR